MKLFGLLLILIVSINAFEYQNTIKSLAQIDSFSTMKNMEKKVKTESKIKAI